MPIWHRVVGELGAAHRDSAVGVGSLSAARFFDFLGCGPRPEGDGVNGANVQGPATSSSGVGDGVFLRRVVVALFLAFFVAGPEDAGLHPHHSSLRHAQEL